MRVLTAPQNPPKQEASRGTGERIPRRRGGAGDGNRTRMASLEGWGLQAPCWLVSVKSGGCRAFHVPQRDREDAAEVGLRARRCPGAGHVSVSQSAGPVKVLE